MKLKEAKKQFIQIWARLGTEWGINQTMVQVHALLFATEKAITTDEVMQDCRSRGAMPISIFVN